MIQLRRHSSKDYAALPDIDASNVGRLTADDHTCLDEIGRCLVEGSAHARFGATLLHSHFPVQGTEILVEEAHPDAQLITLCPLADAPPGLVASSICFDGDMFGLVGLEFTSEDTLAGVHPLGAQDRHVLARVREILCRHGKIARFGLRLLHDPLGLNGRVLLETCDPASRVLTCQTTIEDDPSFAEAVPTLFQWEAGRADDSLAASQGCMQFCKSIRKCASSRSGHKSSNSHETSHDDRL
jgi:hypothetical protein